VATTGSASTAAAAAAAAGVVAVGRRAAVACRKWPTWTGSVWARAAVAVPRPPVSRSTVGGWAVAGTGPSWWASTRAVRTAPVKNSPSSDCSRTTEAAATSVLRPQLTGQRLALAGRLS